MQCILVVKTFESNPGIKTNEPYPSDGNLQRRRKGGFGENGT